MSTWITDVRHLAPMHEPQAPAAARRAEMVRAIVEATTLPLGRLVLQEPVGDRLDNEDVTELATLHELRWRLGRHDGVVVRAGDPLIFALEHEDARRLDLEDLAHLMSHRPARSGTDGDVGGVGDDIHTLDAMSRIDIQGEEVKIDAVTTARHQAALDGDLDEPSKERGGCRGRGEPLQEQVDSGDDVSVADDDA